MKETIQLQSRYSRKTKLAYWLAEPLGENRQLPRTFFLSATYVKDWLVDLNTGVATKLNNQTKI